MEQNVINFIERLEEVVIDLYMAQEIGLTRCGIYLAHEETGPPTLILLCKCGLYLAGTMTPTHGDKVKGEGITILSVLGF